MSGWTVRTLRGDDVATLERLVQLTSPHVNLAMELKQAFTCVWVAEKIAGSPSAYLLVWLVGDELQVVDLATFPEARRQGAARALLEHALAQARDKGLATAQLEVKITNHAARQLYESLSFQTLRVRKGYYANGEDAVEMQRPLKP